MFLEVLVAYSYRHTLLDHIRLIVATSLCIRETVHILGLECLHTFHEF